MVASSQPAPGCLAVGRRARHCAEHALGNHLLNRKSGALTMEILCYGLSHHTAPVEVRERYAIPDSRLGATALELATEPGLGEAVVVTTCNRVEFYLAVEDPGRAFAALDRYIGSHLADPEGFVRHTAPRSIRHLFRVVCGLESMVLGETEIL